MNTKSSIQYSVFSIQNRSGARIEERASCGQRVSAIFQIRSSISKAARAFTLIELLVVIAIIAILAALILPATNIAKAARMRSKARAELNGIAAMIGSYKAKMNFYPPSAGNSSTTNFPFNPLYYELIGTRSTNATDVDPFFITLDNSSALKASDVNNAFGIKGFANVSIGGDEGMNAQNFTKQTLRPSQYGMLTNNNGTYFTILATSIEGPLMLTDKTGVRLNPIGYNSANPTNNPKSYDLWVDILVRGKTERIYSSITTL